MGSINIANSSSRDALVNTETIRSPMRVRWVDQKGRQASSVRVIKSTIATDLESLLTKHGDIDQVAEALVQSDPEIELENAGRILENTSRVYIDKNQRMVHKVAFFEIIHHPDGTQRERRPQKLPEPNIAGAVPLKWTGVYIDKIQACQKFVFSGKIQLRHINGLTYDFLFGMAKELEERNALMLVGAGPKSNQPLVQRRGATPYRGFLEGRTQGDKYCLLLHFSNLELKVPKEPETQTTEETGDQP